MARLMIPCFAAILGFVSAIKAQTSPLPQPPPDAPTHGSMPQINGDGTVTFKLFAPNAKQVFASGDFALKPVELTKDSEGIWSTTVGPLAPDMYGYSFNVDGQGMPDPNNTTPQVGTIWFFSRFVVPGPRADFLLCQNVPHGQLRQLWYYSDALQMTRSVIVYVPPGYDDSLDQRYPVLYLLHGYGDDETGWINSGQANYIMDNLIASGKARPAIVVMPFGHPSRQWLIDRERHSTTTPGTRPSGDPAQVAVLGPELMDSVIPLIEKTFRVKADVQDRAIAGLSMGGRQALEIGLTHLDRFSYVAGFSAGLPKDMSPILASFLANPDQANAQLKLLWLGVGDQDRLLVPNQNFDRLLTEHGIKHEFVISPGYPHAWTLWRKYLRDLVPRLFVQ
jgi:enterochelin esterase-like enzyme